MAARSTKSRAPPPSKSPARKPQLCSLPSAKKHNAHAVKTVDALKGSTVFYGYFGLTTENVGGALAAISTMLIAAKAPPTGQQNQRPGRQHQATTPASALSPTACTAPIAHCSSISEVSPVMPMAPITAPRSSRISTPPAAGTSLPSAKLFSAPMKAGRCCASAAMAREPLPSATAPQALAMAICGRSRLAPSSRSRLIRWPPASSTATVKGAADTSRPSARAWLLMVVAVCRFKALISGALLKKWMETGHAPTASASTADRRDKPNEPTVYNKYYF